MAVQVEVSGGRKIGFFIGTSKLKTYKKIRTTRPLDYYSLMKSRFNLN